MTGSSLRSWGDSCPLCWSSGNVILEQKHRQVLSQPPWKPATPHCCSRAVGLEIWAAIKKVLSLLLIGVADVQEALLELGLLDSQRLMLPKETQMKVPWN